MFVKTKSHQPAGEYKPTGIDAAKKEVDFLLLQVGPNVIEWRNGGRERLTDRKLEKLQA